MPILENKCINCELRGECRDVGTAVTWLHCSKFKPDKSLLVDEKAVRAYELYEKARLEALARHRAAHPRKPRPVRTIEQVWPNGKRIRLFPGGTVEAAEALGLSRNQVYDRLARNGEPTQGDTYGLRYVQEDPT